MNSRLLKLTDAGYLRCFFFGGIGSGRRGYYRLSTKGRRCIGVEGRKSDKNYTSEFWLKHQLALNTAYLSLRGTGLVSSWKTFIKPIIPGLIPDAFAVIGARPCFIEIDRGTERLATWEAKVDRYLELARSGAYRSITEGQPFSVLVMTVSDGRARTLRKATTKLTTKIFWFASLKNINSKSWRLPIWLRPEGDVPTLLLGG